MRRIYLDHAATTPLDPSVQAVMDKAPFGNPSSLHAEGQAASAAVFRARRAIAESLGAQEKNIVFTGSATEANNLALRGAVKTYKSKTYRLIVSAVEHESVRETARMLKTEGAELIHIPVDRNGIVRLAALERALTPRTVLVSIVCASSETGSIQPIEKIAKIIDNWKSEIGNFIYPLLHTDAVQAFQYLPCRVSELGVDLLTLSAHKIYGPKGVGLLYVRDRAVLAPMMAGGGQEQGFRSGTENVAGSMGFAEAVKKVAARRAHESRRLRALRTYAIRCILKTFSRVRLNGLIAPSSPHIMNFFFPGITGHELVIWLDQRGIAASAGSACSSRRAEPSTTLLAMGMSTKRATESVRFSMGRDTSKQDIDCLIRALTIIEEKSGSPWSL